MTLVLDQPPTAVQDAPRWRWRTLVAPLAVLAVLGLLVGWTELGERAPLRGGAWSGALDARPVSDGISTTRYVLPVAGGEQVVLTSVHNGGRRPVTLLGVDQERSLSWVTATFRDRGTALREIGYPSAAAARAAVTDSSVRLEPGATADVLVRFDPVGVTIVDGSFSELDELVLSVRHLGVGSSQRIPLLSAPVAFVGEDAFARLEREGRIPPS